MEVVIGLIVIVALFWIYRTKKAVNGFNALTREPFAVWYRTYSASSMPQTLGLARAFLTQTVHLAVKAGAISEYDRKGIEAGLRTEDPVAVLHGWFDTALPHVFSVVSEEGAFQSEARLVGVYMVVAVLGMVPERDLRAFLKRYDS